MVIKYFYKPSPVCLIKSKKTWLQYVHDKLQINDRSCVTKQKLLVPKWNLFLLFLGIWIK